MTWKDEFGRRRQTTAGKVLVEACRRADAKERQLNASDPAAQRARTANDLIDAYVDPARPKFDKMDHRNRAWSSNYADNIDRLLLRVRPAIGDIDLGALNQRQFYRLVNDENTYNQALTMRSFLRCLVAYGVDKNFLRADQHNLAKVDIFVAVGPRPRQVGFTTPEEGEDPSLIEADEIPSHQQVQRLASAILNYPHGEGLVNTLAYCGPRIHEAIPLTAHHVLKPTAEHPDDTFLRISCQLVEPRGGGVRIDRPKNYRRRSVRVPELTPTGFQLADWLSTRADEAMAEQAAGTNDHALLFPTPRAGTYWRLRNLRARVLLPALVAAEWPFDNFEAPATYMKGGKLVRVTTLHTAWKFGFHSLRHVFATTAINEWGWREEMLCRQGGWASEEFVRRRYYGTTNEVLAAAGQLQREAIERRRSGRPHLVALSESSSGTSAPSTSGGQS